MVGTVDEYVMAKKLHQEDEHGLTKFDRVITGPETVRLNFPLGGRYHIRRAASILRGLADQLDHLSRRDGLKERLLVLAAQTEVRDAQREIRQSAEATGKGKRPPAYRRRLDEPAGACD